MACLDRLVALRMLSCVSSRIWFFCISSLFTSWITFSKEDKTAPNSRVIGLVVYFNFLKTLDVTLIAVGAPES